MLEESQDRAHHMQDVRKPYRPSRNSGCLPSGSSSQTNELMSAGITDQAALDDILSRWMTLNRVRVGLWTVRWLAMMSCFGLEAFTASEIRNE